MLDNAFPECLYFIWCPRKRETLVPGLMCTVTQLSSPSLKFRSREGGKQASRGMYRTAHRGHSPPTVGNRASHRETAKNHRTQEKPILYNCSSLACSGSGPQPASNVGQWSRACLGLLPLFRVQLLSYFPLVGTPTFLSWAPNRNFRLSWPFSLLIRRNTSISYFLVFFFFLRIMGFTCPHSKFLHSNVSLEYRGAHSPGMTVSRVPIPKYSLPKVEPRSTQC